MKEIKVHPAITIVGSVLLVGAALAAIVYLRASKDLDQPGPFGPRLVQGRDLPPATAEHPARPTRPGEAGRQALVERLSAAALAQVGRTVTYDPAYVRISYPGGDVPEDRGVCSDVIVRAYRKAGIDLQKLVHEDMAAHFAAYPKVKGRSGPDANIDHRRVYNLMTFFKRAGAAVVVSRKAGDYQPGDVVAWELSNGRQHIGLVVGGTGVSGRPLVVHNIGSGAKAEDVLFAWKIIGHYRYPR